MILRFFEEFVLPLVLEGEKLRSIKGQLENPQFFSDNAINVSPHFKGYFCVWEENNLINEMQKFLLDE